jgi:plastocyanin
MQSTAFNPPNIVVSPGATVTWTNNDGINHNVTFAGAGIAASGNFASGSRSIVMPTAAGTYGYTCTLHGGMNGTVKVQ